MTEKLQGKGPKLMEILRKCSAQMERHPEIETISIKVPRYAVKEEAEVCEFLGVKGKFINKTTCCLQIEFPVRDLHRALSNVTL